jgi:hypothetical protein
MLGVKELAELKVWRWIPDRNLGVCFGDSVMERCWRAFGSKGERKGLCKT